MVDDPANEVVGGGEALTGSGVVAELALFVLSRYLQLTRADNEFVLPIPPPCCIKQAAEYLQ